MSGDGSCRATNAAGSPCGADANMIDENGLCPTHRPGGIEHMRAAAVAGGLAAKRKRDGGGFEAADLPPIVTLDDAKLALDAVRIAILTRKITHSEGASAAKAISEWCKAEAQAATARLVNELTKELDAKTKEIEELRRQLAGPSRMRAG